MNKLEIKLPENTTATLSIEDGFAVLEFEEKKEGIEIGKWYEWNQYTLLNFGYRVVGFNGTEWYDNSSTPDMLVDYVPANMNKVRELLIGEAKKRGWNTVNICHMQHSNEIRVIGEDGILFSSLSGKWATIIEPKTPIYTNSYGTEFFEGDEYSYVIKQDLSIYAAPGLTEINCPDPKETEETSEIMTKKECHRYIYENYDKLSK